MKKNNLLKTLAISAFVGLNVLNVNAANRGIDASKCENGVVYTNYYYLVAAQVYQPAYAYGNDITANLVTRGYYNNMLPSDVRDVLGPRGFNNRNEIQFEEGTVPVTTAPTNGINNINIYDFYSDFMLVGKGTRVGNTFKMADHTWAKVTKYDVGQEITGGALVGSYSNIDLAKASLKLANEPKTYMEGSSTLDKQTIEISRTYANATPYFSDYKPVSLTKTDTGYNANWYLQPALHYIQYCVEKKNTDNPTPISVKSLNYVGNGDNVTNVPASQIFYTNESATVSSVIPVRTGYTFKGWNTKSDGTGMNYAIGTKVYETTTLYAQWESNQKPENLVLSYDGNGDNVTNVPNAQTFTSGSVVNVTNITPVRTGYTFLGWNTKADGTGMNYVAGSPVDKTMTLYAMWKKNGSVTPIDNNDNRKPLPENPKTGVESYVLPFGGAVTLALSGLGVLKKKKSFLQF